MLRGTDAGPTPCAGNGAELGLTAGPAHPPSHSPGPDVNRSHSCSVCYTRCRTSPGPGQNLICRYPGPVCMREMRNWKSAGGTGRRTTGCGPTRPRRSTVFKHCQPWPDPRLTLQLIFAPEIHRIQASLFGSFPEVSVLVQGLLLAFAVRHVPGRPARPPRKSASHHNPRSGSESCYHGVISTSVRNRKTPLCSYCQHRG